MTLGAGSGFTNLLSQVHSPVFVSVLIDNDNTGPTVIQTRCNLLIDVDWYNLLWLRTGYSEEIESDEATRHP